MFSLIQFLGYFTLFWVIKLQHVYSRQSDLASCSFFVFLFLISIKLKIFKLKFHVRIYHSDVDNKTASGCRTISELPLKFKFTAVSRKKARQMQDLLKLFRNIQRILTRLEDMLLERCHIVFYCVLVAHLIFGWTLYWAVYKIVRF